jgi:hypothetical protein
MALLGLILIVAAIAAANYKKERTVPAKETTTLKPLIYLVLALFGLALFFLFGKSSEPEPKTATTPTVAQPARVRD